MPKKSKLIPAEGFPIDKHWKDLPLAVIDFETTGLDPEKDRVVEYGIVLIENGNLRKSIGGLLDPGFDIPAEATKVHGITNEDVKGCPSFEKNYDYFESLLRNHIPVAYNAKFDREFMLNEAGRIIRAKVEQKAKELQTAMITPEMIESQIDPDKLPAAFKANVEWIDPLVWVRDIQKYEKGKTLVDACKRLGIDLKAHRAVNDAEATGKVLLALADQIGETRYDELIRKQQALDFEQQLDYEAWRRRNPR
jgi:DNA polymerase-3 subunit epsilon